MLHFLCQINMRVLQLHYQYKKLIQVFWPFDNKFRFTMFSSPFFLRKFILVVVMSEGWEDQKIRKWKNGNKEARKWKFKNGEMGEWGDRKVSWWEKMVRKELVHDLFIYIDECFTFFARSTWGRPSFITKAGNYSR